MEMSITGNASILLKRDLKRAGGSSSIEVKQSTLKNISIPYVVHKTK
jgi:hypothetical protein